MLTNRPARSRGAMHAPPPGFTLFEMMLVLVLSAVVLGVVSAIGNRLQRQLHDTSRRIGTAEQLSTASAILPLDLRPLSPADGDIPSGEARDSSLELRSTIGSGVVCGHATGTLVVAPFSLAGGRHASWSAEAGDTLWVLSEGDTAGSWRALIIRGVYPVRTSCSSLTGAPTSLVFDLDHLATIEVQDSVPVAGGSMVRVTRPIRYSIYRSSDGLWYVGLQSWSATTTRFNVVQPLSGPYAPPSPDGTRIEYFDADGNRVPPGASDTRAIARVEWVLRGMPGRDTTGTDSTRVVIGLRNRR